jgi:hypothetical protein
MDIGLCGRLDFRTSGVMLMTDDAILNRAIRDPPKNELDDEDDDDENVIDQVEGESQNQWQEREQDKDKEEEGKSLENDERYLKYKSKVYLVKVTGERLNQIASMNHAHTADPHIDTNLDTHLNTDDHVTLTPPPLSPLPPELTNLINEISLPFQFVRHHVIRQTTSAEIILKNFYQDNNLRTLQRPQRGWCLDLEICIREGKHHQIRRMIRRSHLKLLTLCRIQIASILRIESVPSPGDCRWLEEWEVDEIYHALQIKRSEE